MYPEQQQSSPFGSAHPILIIGIFFFIAPYFKYIQGLSWIPGWLGGIGIAMILIGSVMSVYKLSQR